ncbi:MAG: zinc ABC transporter substrate-binding protein [Hyphomicrobiaceae bacterium]
MSFRWRWLRGCALAAAWLSTAGSTNAAEPSVVVTVKPVHALVAAVMQGAGSPHLLIDGGASPHSYAMKPSEMRRLAEAELVVRVSSGLEVFLEKPLAMLGSRTRVVALDRIPGMRLHALRDGAAFEAHGHADEKGGHGHRHDHGRSHAQASGHSRAAPGASIDGHLWLDPGNARIAALYVAEALAAAVPSAADTYRANARALADRLAALDQRLAGELQPLSQRRFLVFHDAYQYFERRYGLAGVGSVTVSPEVPPSARRLSAIRARLARDNVVCVFAEPQFPSRVIGTIVEGTGVRRATLDPLGAALPAGPGQYFALMEGLVRDLKDCLAGSA